MKPERITDACIAWARAATPGQRATYIRTGSRGPGMPVDLAPKSVRIATVRKALRVR